MSIPYYCTTALIKECHDKWLDATPTPSKEGVIYLHDTLTLFCRKCGGPWVAKVRCNDRTCPECRKKDFFRLYNGYSKAIHKTLPFRHLFRLLTLTLKNIQSDDYLDVVLACKNIIKAFSKLRRKKAYKGKFVAGLRGLEVKYREGKGWNVHLHVFFQGEYLMDCCKSMKNANSYEAISLLEKNKCSTCKIDVCLRRDWKRVTGGHPVIHIERIYNIKKGLGYLMKYLTKPPELDGKEGMYNEIMKGVRIVQGFGKWFKIKIPKHHFKCPKCENDTWMSEHELRAAIETPQPP